MDIPEGLMIDVTDMKRYKPSQLTLITTGSQGEPMSALYRMAFGGALHRFRSADRSGRAFVIVDSRQ